MAISDTSCSRQVSAPLQTVVGFACPSDASPGNSCGASSSPRSKLPESPLAQLLKKKQLPRLQLGRAGPAAPAPSRPAIALERRSRSYDMDVPAVPDRFAAQLSTSAGHLSRSSEPIAIPCGHRTSLPKPQPLAEAIDAPALVANLHIPASVASSASSAKSTACCAHAVPTCSPHALQEMQHQLFEARAVTTSALTQLRGVEEQCKQEHAQAQLLTEKLRAMEEQRDLLLAECATLAHAAAGAVAREVFDMDATVPVRQSCFVQHSTQHRASLFGALVA